MSSNKIKFDSIDLGEKRQFILVGKIIFEIKQNIESKQDIDLLLNIIKLGNAAELAVKGFLTSLEVEYGDNTRFSELLGKNYLNGEYINRFGVNLPYVQDLKNMYKQRNQAQHGGILANSEDIKRWFQKFNNFISKVFSQIFDISFDVLDLSVLLKNPERKKLFQDFIKLIDEKEWEEALIFGDEIYRELIERYTQNNYNYIFNLYIKYIDDDNLFSSLEELFKRDILSFLKINPRDLWEIENNAIMVRMKNQMKREEQKQNALELKDSLFELMLQLDYLKEEHDIKQDHFFCDKKEISTQYSRLHGSVEKPTIICRMRKSKLFVIVWQSYIQITLPHNTTEL